MSGAQVTAADAPAAPGRRERRRAENRARLLAAARTVMLRDGYDRATIAEIARAADLGFGTFYSHFESKEAVFIAAVDEARDARARVLAYTLEGVSDPAARLATTFALFVALSDRHREITRFLLEARRRAENPGTVAAVHPFRALVADACANGQVAVGHEAAAVSAITGAILELIQDLLDDRLVAAHAIETAAHVCLRILGVAPSDAEPMAEAAIARAVSRLDSIENDNG